MKTKKLFFVPFLLLRTFLNACSGKHTQEFNIYKDLGISRKVVINKNPFQI